MSIRKSSVACLFTALACCPLASAATVVLGTDYLQTSSAVFDFPVIGLVTMTGVPIGPGNTDTIVQRQADATIGGGQIPIQLMALSLKNTSPVNVGGNFYDVSVTLDPANLGNDTGHATYSGSTAGGTFTSDLNVYFTAMFTPVGAGSPFLVPGNVLLTNSGASWLPTPPPGAVIVPGPHDGSAADQAANLHSGLINECRLTNGIVCEVDAFVDGPLTHRSDDPPASSTVTTASAVPEPATWALIGMALAGLVIGRRRLAI